MGADGLRPEWFGTQITAADFEDVRRSLGVERWTVYALSYGTGVAMTMMALHPESLRAVVLDSVFPPEPVPITLTQSFGDALDRLFAACAAQTACEVAHPDLRAAYQQAEQGLDAEGLTVPLPPGLGFKTLKLRSEVFRLLVNVAMYSRRGLEILPLFIENARGRNPTALEGVVSSIVQSYQSNSEGVMAAVECRDRASWQAAVASDAGDPPVSAFVPGMCTGWSPPGQPPLIAHDTKIPTLLLAGTIDPITPPAFAHLAASALGALATVVEVANVGHAVQQASPCSERIVTSFILNPSGPIDAACATQIAPVAFR
jgi:pimeloyl-ACP methyl ester carboxylesterase